MVGTTELTFGTKITFGPAPWQVLQRDYDGTATVRVGGIWAGGNDMCGVEVRVAREYDNTAVPGCDWQRAELLNGNGWRITLRIPTGGLYRIETRMYRDSDDWRGAGAKIWHIAVGDLWVIAGQSNSTGCGGHGMVVDPPALGVSVYGLNDEWRLATHPIFDQTDSHYPANTDCGWVDVSPWLAFGKEILAQAQVPIGLIPAGLGGSPLKAWDPEDEEGNPYLFDNMANMIDAAGGKIAGMVWYQGCSDSNEHDAASYLARFTRFVANVRARYGIGLPIITAQLNRDINPAPEVHRYWSIVREAQRQAARTIPGVAVVTTQDVSMSDAIHTSANGNVVLGQRFARVALGMVYGQPIDWQPVDVQSAHFTDQTRTRVRLQFGPVANFLIFTSNGSMRTDFCFEDADGFIYARNADVVHTDVYVDLERPAQGRTVCHNMYGNNPVSTLRDHLGRPVLAFYGVEVEESE